MTGRQEAPEQVRCIACGVRVQRSAAREYDRFGDRWDRADKDFEYLCKQCHGEACHQPRQGLEATLTGIGSEHESPHAFIAAYYTALDHEAEHDELD